MTNSNDFWAGIDKLLAECKIIIDRPKGSRHPNYPDVVYPLDYGYLEGTTAMDGGGIDVWLGSAGRRADAVICAIDLFKRDAEIKILVGCTEDEKRLAMPTHESMKGILIQREDVLK